MQRLNPLHSVDMLTQQMRMTGCYPERERCTGRSTALALELIAAAINAPYTWHTTADHYRSVDSDSEVRLLCQDMVRKLDLRHFHFKDSAIAFGRP